MPFKSSPVEGIWLKHVTCDVGIESSHLTGTIGHEDVAGVALDAMVPVCDA